jgi:hypothetical protein
VRSGAAPRDIGERSRRAAKRRLGRAWPRRRGYSERAQLGPSPLGQGRRTPRVGSSGPRLKEALGPPGGRAWQPPGRHRSDGRRRVPRHPTGSRCEHPRPARQKRCWPRHQPEVAVLRSGCGAAVYCRRTRPCGSSTSTDTKVRSGEHWRTSTSALAHAPAAQPRPPQRPGSAASSVGLLAAARMAGRRGGGFQGLDAEQRLAEGGGVSPVAQPRATLLLLSFGPGRWRPLVGGASQEEVDGVSLFALQQGLADNQYHPGPFTASRGETGRSAVARREGLRGMAGARFGALQAMPARPAGRRTGVPWFVSCVRP